MANKKKSKKKKKVQKNNKSKLSIIIILAILIIGGICAYLVTSPNFKIKNISIIGNKQLTNQQVMQIASVEIGDNIFSKINIILRVKLKQNGYIENVNIKKIYPDTLEIQIKERTKQYQIKTETETYINIDEQGYLIDYSTEKIEIPTIIGMDIKQSDYDLLKRLEKKDLNKMENILQIREEFKKIEIADQITQINVSDEYIIDIKEGKKINIGDATNLKNRMYYVTAILKQESGKTGTIYVNGNLNEGFSPYFREN